MKPFPATVAGFDAASENAKSPTPAERFTTTPIQSNTDVGASSADKLLQLEQPELLQMKDSEGRQLIGFIYDNSATIPAWIKLNGKTFERCSVNSVVEAKSLVRFREITPEEEADLSHNQVDSGHDGILA